MKLKNYFLSIFLFTATNAVVIDPEDGIIALFTFLKGYVLTIN
jgi:hypothetical protein